MSIAPSAISLQHSFINKGCVNGGLAPMTALPLITLFLYKRSVMFSIKCNVEDLGEKE